MRQINTNISIKGATHLIWIIAYMLKFINDLWLKRFFYLLECFTISFGFVLGDFAMLMIAFYDFAADRCASVKTPIGNHPPMLPEIQDSSVRNWTFMYDSRKDKRATDIHHMMAIFIHVRPNHFRILETT